MSVIIQAYIAKLGLAGVVLFVVVVMIAFNVLLTMLLRLLQYVAVVTQATWVGSAIIFDNKLLDLLHKALSYMSANTTFLPPNVAALLEKAVIAGDIPGPTVTIQTQTVSSQTITAQPAATVEGQKV